MFNISTRKVGGIRFLKVGRLCFSFCVTKRYKAMTDHKVIGPRYHALGAAKHPRHFIDLPSSQARIFRTSQDGVLVLGYADEA
jgi:hypothetical protein